MASTNQPSDEHQVGITNAQENNPDAIIAHAKPMNNEHTIDELIDAFNAQAKAEGRHDNRTFWQVPARPGSILDIPETEKSKDDLAWFRARRLAKEKARARSGLPTAPAAPAAPSNTLPEGTVAAEH